MDKLKLDTIIRHYKAQPVGYGYIDIIVSRENYKEFIEEIVKSGYQIDSISWWEYCLDNKEPIYGLGGPESVFYDGWFAEIPIKVDEIQLSANLIEREKIDTIINLIKTKTISFTDEKITFRDNQWLTPAIWLDVPNEWRNKHSI